MKENPQKETETFQKAIARSIATHPAGRNLALIGGFRYRLLDDSVRTSADIDYHWIGDLAEKQKELIDFFGRVLLPEIFRRYGYSGSANVLTGPAADSPLARVVDLAFWKDGVPYSRIEIPVEVTRIVCADPVEVRTAGGTIFATVSEGDMIESKVIAIFGRTTPRHRDIVDVFLFQDRFLPDSDKRLKSKLQSLGIISNDTEKQIMQFQTDRDYHAKATQAVIDTQLDLAAAAQLNDAGGGKMVLDKVISILKQYIQVGRSDESH